MKELFTKVKNKVCSVGKKVAVVAAPAMVAMNTMALAAPNTNIDIWAVVSSILGVISTIALILGIILLAVGLVQFAMAQKSEDVEGKSRAINTITASLILIGFKALFSVIFTTMGITF